MQPLLFTTTMYVTKPTRSTQPCIPPGSLNRVPALIGWGKGGNVTSAGWQVILCDPIWHVNSRSGAVLVVQTAIRFLTFARCSLTKLRLRRVSSLDAMLLLSSVRLCRNSSSECVAGDSTEAVFAMRLSLVFRGVLEQSVPDAVLTAIRSELHGVDGKLFDDAVSFSSVQFSNDTSWDVDWLAVKHGRFGVPLEVPYWPQRFKHWLKL